MKKVAGDNLRKNRKTPPALHILSHQPRNNRFRVNILRLRSSINVNRSLAELKCGNILPKEIAKIIF
jgi:hypothetical protein